MTLRYSLVGIFIVIALLLGCGSEKVKIEQREGVRMDYKPTRSDLIPLNVSVDDATDPWWFHDCFMFVSRISDIGNILMVAEFDRYLNPGDDPKVTKQFRLSRFDGTSWQEIDFWEGPDVISKMDMISSTPKINFFWADKDKSASIRYLSLTGGATVIDLKDLVAYTSYGNGTDYKHTYAAGIGRVEHRDTVIEGRMFHEFINVRLDEPWDGKRPSLGAENRFTAFIQTAASKTIIASVDMNEYNDAVHNPFFAMLHGSKYYIAEGSMITNFNADFKSDSQFGGQLPHFIQIYSGDSINVTLEFWIENDKWDTISDGWARTGVWGNTVFWNRREKAYGITKHYHDPGVDSLQLLGKFHEIRMERPDSDPDFVPSGEPVHIERN